LIKKDFIYHTWKNLGKTESKTEPTEKVLANNPQEAEEANLLSDLAKEIEKMELPKNNISTDEPTQHNKNKPK
jgi:hypothetical protein